MKARTKLIVASSAVAILLFSASGVLAYVSPGKPTGLINDFAKVLTAQQVRDLEVKVGNFARPAGVQMAVVTVPTLGDETIETYAVKLFEEWGIGQKLKDNGVLILVAPNDRQVRIEVGYGLEPVITDAMASVVINSGIIPQFKAGDYYAGIVAGTDSVIKLVEGDPEYSAQVRDAANQPQGSGSRAISVLELVAFIIILIIILSTRTGRRILFYMFISGMFNNNGRGGGGGMGGGGFGGFGGGRSGGGGASGRW